MPRRSVRRRKRTLGCLSFAIGALALAAVCLIVAIVVTQRMNADRTDAPVPVESGGEYVDANNPPESDMVLTADTYTGDAGDEAAEPTAPDVTATPTPEPAPTLDPNDPTAALRPLPASAGLLPVYKRANTTEKVIAITLDECVDADITGRFVRMANYFDAALTLFPTGENIRKTGMGKLLKECVFEYGFEIENRGYSDAARLYQYVELLMVEEVWKQTMALDFVLGVDYQPHFFRMYGGLGENDPRTNAYLIQEGYIGIAHWTHAASGMDLDKLLGSLAPGNVYQFKSTEEDGMLMYQLMRAAREQGYRMVTLNELFGLPANTVTQVEESALLAATMPEFEYDSGELYDLYPGDAHWAVAKMQARLTQLGYLPEGSADGIFGNATAAGLRLFQAQCGLAATGAADVNTQRRLYGADAPQNPNPLDIGHSEDPFGEPDDDDGEDGLIEEGEMRPSGDVEEEYEEIVPEDPFKEPDEVE